VTLDRVLQRWPWSVVVALMALVVVANVVSVLAHADATFAVIDLMSVFRIPAGIGGMGGDGRVELGCFLSSLISSVLLYLSVSNRRFKMA
jgi:hypothetical protein